MNATSNLIDLDLGELRLKTQQGKAMTDQFKIAQVEEKLKIIKLEANSMFEQEYARVVNEIKSNASNGNDTYFYPVPFSKNEENMWKDISYYKDGDPRIEYYKRAAERLSLSNVYKFDFKRLHFINKNRIEMWPIEEWLIYCLTKTFLSRKIAIQCLKSGLMVSFGEATISTDGVYTTRGTYSVHCLSISWI